MNAPMRLCLRMGDNALVLGQRNGEWCGHAPVLEEDIALANMALDLIGQVQLWYGLAGELEGKGRKPDNFAYLRGERGFLNALLVEQPNTDFAYTLMRQYLFDAWHLGMLEALSKSGEERVAAIAAKASKEARYHLDRSRDLVIRLGDGSAESHQRMQAALDWLWPYTGDLFAEIPEAGELEAAGVEVDMDELRRRWLDETGRTLRAAALSSPEDGFQHSGSMTGVHTEHLGYLLADLQYLQRAYPGCNW